MTGLPPGIDPRRVLEEVRGRRDQFVSLLEALCRQESPSLDPGGQQAVHAVLAANLDALGFAVRMLPGPRSGGHLYARPRRRGRGAPVQVLLGHYDTVWPAGSLARMPFAIEGDEVVFLIAEIENAAVGYVKINLNSRDDSVQGSGTIENERIYAAKEHIDKGVGK